MLKKHISDIWAAIVSYNLNDDDQFHSFCDFIIARCFQEFSGRVFRDQVSWNVSVQKKIFDWKPLNREIVDVRWIDRPKWALLALPETKIDGLITRTIEKFGQPVVQWQLSNATLGFWAWLLATIIKQLELAVNGARIVRETQDGDEGGGDRGHSYVVSPSVCISALERGRRADSSNQDLAEIFIPSP